MTKTIQFLFSVAEIVHFLMDKQFTYVIVKNQIIFFTISEHSKLPCQQNYG